MSKIIYVTGAMQSGASGFAQNLALKYKKVAYIETFTFEDETARCMDKTACTENWDLFKQATEIDKLILHGGYDVFILNNATAMLAEWVYGSSARKGDPPASAREKIEEYIMQSVQKLMLSSIVVRKDLIILSCEAGFGLTAYYPYGTFFMKLCGKINEMIASEADEVYLMVSGIPLKLKGKE